MDNKLPLQDESDTVSFVGGSDRDSVELLQRLLSLADSVHQPVRSESDDIQLGPATE